LTIGTLSPNRFIKFHTGGATQEHLRAEIGDTYFSCSVPMGVGHTGDVDSWLSIGGGTSTRSSLHFERASTNPVTASTPQGSIWIGQNCGLLRGIIGGASGGTGTTGWFPFTIFKQTNTVEISGSITGSQSISSGVPPVVIFDRNYFQTQQIFSFTFMGDATYVGNNRDVVFSIIAQTYDGGATPVTSSTLFTTGTIRFNTLSQRMWQISGQINPTATGSLCTLGGTGEFYQFTAVNTKTPFDISSNASIDNSKPIRLALVAGWVGGNTTSDKIRCKNGHIMVT
jgi:hypothetical protein